ncbi:sugar ABC transporter ATP-binding protein [Flavobacterium cellulosilyticum]|uniref:Sugar ABC transporter ATP-binding protein n=1 Tax=Flavobacterium cellulosilyticum TaxID=2541731 RepID=A0A4R5C8Z9_9FLAO|nr:sugar ABC transporter ATP-binding protein [Flavobacterium cellulosilyticum]TDD93482.1 sugar ABC transporter ATP-binding protein [Flavobacterium cellulosilyticum]
MLEAVKISKEFPGVKVLNQVYFKFYPGKVNAILGENGAGKSTLLKILTGVYNEYDGEIKLNGETVTFSNIKEAQNAGIAIIHQELNLIPELSVTENLFLGREIITPLGLLDTNKMEAEAKIIFKKIQLNVTPKTLVQKLKVGEQQLIEIAKALLCNADVILMDEPTSALSDSEIENLHRIIRELKIEGKTIVYISHKMDELFRIAENYTVLRDGNTIDAGEMKNTTEQDLIRKMVGREVLIEKKNTATQFHSTILKVKDLNLINPVIKNRKILQDISFELKKGEILGVFGLMGAGRTELLETIFGMHPKTSDYQLEIDGKKAFHQTPKDSIENGLAFVTEDRKTEGLVLGMDISSNISLTTLPTFGILNNTKSKNSAKYYIEKLSIKTPSETQLCQNLSGGNQQKVVLAKWLVTNPKILILDEPTRGIDINAKNEIYNLIKELAANNMSIIVASSEIPEILALSDRILVMADGKLKDSFLAREATEDKLLKSALPE